MKAVFSLLVLLLFLTACAESGGGHAPDETHTAIAAVDSVAAAIEARVDEVYAGFSFARGGQPDFVALRRLFTPEARLMWVSGDSLVVQTVDAYLAGFEQALAGGGLEMLHEWELAGATEHFGGVAHRMSAYAVHANTTDSLAERGMISFQLARVGGAWRVQSMLWDKEKEGRPLPAKYDR